MRREPLTNREILTIVENLYDLILGVEQVKRDQPLPDEEQERHDEWYVLFIMLWYRLTFLFKETRLR